MTLKQIKELMILKDWTRQDLADSLGISKNLIDRWFCKEEKNQRYPRVAECLIMKIWLNEARKESRHQPA
jgi:transcriptional regulator with XRE-family HTH domain